MTARKGERELGGQLNDLRASTLLLGVQLLLAKHRGEAAACPHENRRQNGRWQRQVGRVLAGVTVAA